MSKKNLSIAYIIFFRRRAIRYSSCNHLNKPMIFQATPREWVAANIRSILTYSDLAVVAVFVCCWTTSNKPDFKRSYEHVKEKVFKWSIGRHHKAMEVFSFGRKNINKVGKSLVQDRSTHFASSFIAYIVLTIGFSSEFDY